MISDKNESLLWESLEIELYPWIKECLVSLGYLSMTPVQKSTISLFCGNKDVIVESFTGSGKTLGFVIPILQRITKMIFEKIDENGNLNIRKNSFYALVIGPTRELASQINSVFEKFLSFLPESIYSIKTQLLVGLLNSFEENYAEFTKKNPLILVGTPGKLLEFLSSSKITTKSMEMLVMDEVDKLLDMDYRNEVKNILNLLPKQIRIGLFSATISSNKELIFKTRMRNPVKITLKSDIESNYHTPSLLKNEYILIKPKFKILALKKILLNVSFRKSIVYFPTCVSVNYFYLLFKNLFFNNVEKKNELIKFFSLHGKLSTKSRFKILKKFSVSQNVNLKFVLFTTDLSARGLDIENIDLVIQVEPPTDPVLFIHKCGRTARANKSGNAILFLNDNSHEVDYIDFMELKKVLIIKREFPIINDEEFTSFLKIIRSFISKEKRHYELAVRSFVSHVKFFSKHQILSIFRLSEFDFIGIATMYGLFKIPKMPELKYISKENLPTNNWLVDPSSFDLSCLNLHDQETSTFNLSENLIEKKKRKKLENVPWSKKKSKKIKTEKIKTGYVLKKNLSEDENEIDWKELVKKNKLKKKNNSSNFFFEDPDLLKN